MHSDVIIITWFAVFDERKEYFFTNVNIFLTTVPSFFCFFFNLSCSNVSTLGVGRSSEVEHSLMVRWVVGSILHGVDPLSYFMFQPVLHDWCNKGCGMCYPVCGMVHIKTLS